MFELNYQMTKEDYIEFNEFHSKNSKTVMRSINFTRMLVPILIFFFLFISGNIKDLVMISIFSIYSVLWFIFSSKIILYSIRKKVLKMVEEDNQGDLFTLKKITIDNSRIHWQSENSAGNYNWSTVVKVCETNKAVYIYVSSIQALVIPKRLSSQMIDMKELVDYCREKINYNN